jgi:acyl dehydratase
MDYLYFEDCIVGQRFETAPITITQAEIIAFAEKFDPQPIHTDPQAALTITGGLIASGWHTAALTMNRMVTSDFYNPAPGTLGMGIKDLKWLRPVRPGDQLRATLEVIEVRESAQKPAHGIVTQKVVTLNQHNQPVQELISSAMLPKRKT